MQLAKAPQNILAVDVGQRCGLALYGPDGRLRWYRSHDFEGRDGVRRAARELIGGPGSPPDGIAWLITEGDVGLAAIWERAAMRCGVRVQRVSNEAWQQRLLTPAARRDGVRGAAHGLARRIIAWSGAPPAASLRHDAAGAILIGLWGALSLGWLARPPAFRAALAASPRAASP